MEDKKKDNGKAIIHLSDNPTSHSGVNEKSLLDVTSGPPDVLPNLGPFGNVFNFPNGGAIDENIVVNEFLSKSSWTSAYENNKVQVKAEQGFEAMTGVKPSYVSDACGGPSTYHQRRVEELTSSLYHTEGMLAMVQAMNRSMQVTINSLRSENESLKLYYTMQKEEGCDDEASNHEDASDTGDAHKQQQQVIPQTTAISNIKLPILKKEEYDIWAMEMEHYLEYIDNDVWKVIQNGNSKKRISTGKDGVIRILPPVTAVEIQVVEKERKAKNILLMAIPKEHMRRFHGMDDAKEIWEAIRTRFGGNANSKKMQKAVFKQQFEAFTISSSEGLEKGYDRFQQLLSQLEAHGAEVSTEDANHKFLISLPPSWSNLAMTMRTKPDVDTLSIDDLYNNLRVFEQEIQGASKTSSSAQNVAFVSQSKSSTNKVKSGFTGAYSTCTPSTSSTNIPEKEALAGFADEVIYSLFAKQSKD
ncbi:hypothetical protein Tco_1053204 [Tanacetum coccineum]